MTDEIRAILANYEEASAALHKLWTESVGAPGYDKRSWQRLANALDRITRNAATAAGYPPYQALVPPR